jgi:hypothetical protein
MQMVSSYVGDLSDDVASRDDHSPVRGAAQFRHEVQVPVRRSEAGTVTGGVKDVHPLGPARSPGTGFCHRARRDGMDVVTVPCGPIGAQVVTALHVRLLTVAVAGHEPG